MYVQCAAVAGSLNIVTLPQTIQSCILKILIMVTNRRVIPEHDQGMCLYERWVGRGFDYGQVINGGSLLAACAF